MNKKSRQRRRLNKKYPQSTDRGYEFGRFVGLYRRLAREASERNAKIKGTGAIHQTPRSETNRIVVVPPQPK